MPQVDKIYPSTESMLEKWRALSKEIAETSSTEGDVEQKGELVVIGSGLSRCDFTADSESELRRSDYVFYCLYDRLAQIWISSVRPDAYDLYVLYNDKTERFYTYVQMAEAMLHYVRRGKKVVAIYYGHPGVFATPTHRAVAIAKREGHIARMRPGISALDYLIAEVGFDPAIPGMINYEASDMLLRQRSIDPSLHVVIWQVGLVGDFGFRRAGFSNDGFVHLVDKLRAVYGDEWPVVHYIASRFAGVDPLIEEIPIGKLCEPEFRADVSALSTFYIAPYVAVPTDDGAARRLNLASHYGSVLAAEKAPNVSLYGSSEYRAIKDLASFDTPVGYAVPQHGAASEVLLELARDPYLQAEYRKDPAKYVAGIDRKDLSDREKALLAISHPLALDKCIYEAR